MARTKETGSNAATSSPRVLSGEETGRDHKSAAGSAVSQNITPNTLTSEHGPYAVPHVLHDRRTSKVSQSAAGSTLAQKKSKK